MVGKVFKIYILSWIILFQQALANEVFFLENRGTAVTEYRQTVSRMNALGLAISNTRPPNGPNRRRIRELTEVIRQNARSLSRGVFSPSARDIEKINLVRRSFNEIESLTSPQHLQQIYNYASLHLGNDSLWVENQSDAIADVNEIPAYCENYPALDRELLRSFYDGAQADDESTCYEFNRNGNGVNLDLSNIGEALLSLEDSGHQEQKRELQNGLIQKAIEGILEESSAYAGIYPGTDNNLTQLKSCSANQAAVNMGNHDLRNAVNNYEENLPTKINQFNQAFGSRESARKAALMATQVRQALIISNLYNITTHARADTNGNQVATVGGNYLDQFTPEVYSRCQDMMEAQHGFSMPANTMYSTRNTHSCHELVSQERYQSIGECEQAYFSFRVNIELQTAQRACYYRESGRTDEAPRNIAADNLIPIMSASVNSHPLLFNRDDNRSLIPFVSSESNYVPSDFANLVKTLPGAAEISRAVEDVLATNPEEPRLAIERRLAQADMLTLMSSAIDSAQESESLNNSLKDEITSYQEELGTSAYNVCNSDGEHLHQFPSLVNDVIAEDIQGLTSEEDRERVLARRQAAQCWMLQEDPPEYDGGLPAGFFALGVGAIALGMIPGIGWVASAALLTAGTSLTATDSFLRFDHARDQLNATTAAFNGGWADTSLVLSRAAARTDAHTNLWLEGLTVGILDVASPAARAVTRSLRSNDEIAGAINRFVNDESGAATLPSLRPNIRVADLLETGDQSLVVLTTRRIGDEEIPISVGARSLEHMREHDFPGGTAYIEDLLGRLRSEEISVDFLRGLNSSSNGRPLFDNVLNQSNVQDETINFNHLLSLISEHGNPSGQQLNEGLNRILNEVDRFAFRRAKPTSLYPEEAQLDTVMNIMRRGEGEYLPHPRRDNAFIFNHNGRQYEGTFCSNPIGCGCQVPTDASSCSRSFGELNSLFPTCGTGVYMLSSTPNLVSALVDGALSDPDYISQSRFLGAPITGAATGNFSDGLIRQVNCPN